MTRSAGAVAIFTMAMALAACSSKPPDTGVFVDPSLAILIPGDTTMIVCARVELMAKTPAFAQFAKMEPIVRFTRETGIDPATRLYTLMWISNGRRSILLGRGRFANGLVAPELARQGANRFAYKGMNGFGDEREAVLFLNSSTAVLGETPVVKQIADQSETTTWPPERFAPLLKDIPREAELWGVYAGGPVDLALPGNLANLERLLGMVAQASFYASVSDTRDTQIHVVAKGAADSDQQAQQLHDALQGLMALAQLSGKVDRDGRTVNLKLDANVPNF